MVTTDVTQLAGECNTWRMKLRSHRDQLSKLNNNLQDLAARQHSRQILQDVEHFHNQFHIQLINIHDLKHAIKSHEQKISYEMNVNGGKLNAETVAQHENIFELYQRLDTTLLELRDEFDQFLNRT